MTKTSIKSDLNIGQDSKIRVQWSDRPENYSRDNKNKIKSYFAKKYGVDKNSIQINFTPVKVNDKGEVIEIVGATIDNIMDPNYQKGLFKEWIAREKVEVDFDRLMKLDDIINSELDSDFEVSPFNSWDLKWVKINNFLSYGEDNKLDLSKVSGLTVVKSDPPNFGGKTTLAVDSLKFLFYGRTSKTDRNEEIFNSFTDANALSVKGLITMGNGDSLIIERKLTRSPKRGGGWNVKSSLNYYRILPDGEEEDLNDEDTIKTTREIKKMVGKEEDFDITVLTTGRNLEDLIDATPTENGKLLNKFIGLEVVEVKEQLVRKKYNEFASKKIANIHNPVTLVEDISTNEENLGIYDNLLNNHNDNLAILREKLKELEDSKEKFLLSKKNVVVSINQLNKVKIIEDIENIKQTGKNTREEVNTLVTELKALEGFDYKEELYSDKFSEKLTLENDKTILENKVIELKALIDALKNGEMCPTCNRKLEDVDHSSEIDSYEKNVLDIETVKIPNIVKEIGNIGSILSTMIGDKEKVDRRNILEIRKDKLELNISELTSKFKERQKDLATYNENEEAINFNMELDSKIELTKTDISVTNVSIETVIGKISTIQNNINNAKTLIETNKGLLDKIKKEAETEKIFKIYIEMVGKKGIGKLVLRSVLPIINSEISRLLDDVCEFEVELIINSKNEVEYLLKREGVDKNLKSGSGFEKTVASIALRCVLSRISHLPSPNFISFDEALGKVSPKNFDKVKILFDKIKDMFDVVFLIIQDEELTDWGENEILVKKTNNISKLLVK